LNTLSQLCLVAFFVIILLILTYQVFQNKKLVTKKNLIVEREKFVIEMFREMAFEDFTSPTNSYLRTVDHTAKYLNNIVGDLGNQGIQTVRLVNDNKYVLASYPASVMKKMSHGAASEVVLKGSGEKILIVRDASTGRFLAHAQKAESAAKFNKLATIGNLIVGAAHMISGYDNAKKLGSISKDVSKLVKFRSGDMISELESIYESLQEFDSENIE